MVHVQKIIFYVTFINFSDSPLHLLMRVDMQILKNIAPDSEAAAEANRVFPVPESFTSYV